MDNQKEIEKLQINSMIEFFKWILPTQAMADWIPIRIRHDYKGYAKEFYNQGYRKIDKDSIVLTKQEYERLLKIEKDFNTVHYCFVEKSRVVEASKETAREILDLLVPDCKVCDENWHNGCLCLRATLAEKIAKQYGVIGEENV